MSASAQELYELNQSGRSYEILASQNGMTRSSIAGKIFRWKKQNNIGQKTRNPVKRAVVKTTVASLNIDLEDLKNRRCRYPYGDGPFTFCGHPVKEKSPYCEEHHKICFKGIKTRQATDSTNLGSWG